MSILAISSVAPRTFQRPGTTASLRIWYQQNFETAEGLTILGGPTRSSSMYINIPCTLDPTTHILTIPSFSLPTTNDSSIRNVRASGLLFDSSGAFTNNYLFKNWIIPSQLAPTCTFAELNAYNSATNTPPGPTYPTTDQVEVLINNAVGTLNDASDVVKGRTYLTEAPVLATFPLAVADNDPRMAFAGQDVINVTLAPYNADNTGATDATEAIQDAINSGAGRIYLPAGTYLGSQDRIDSVNVLIDLYFGHPSVEIFGDGMGKTIITVPNGVAYNAGGTFIISSSNGDKQSVHDITFQGPTSQSGFLTVLAASQTGFRSHFYDNELTGWSGAGDAGAGLITTYQPYDISDVDTTLGTTIAAGTRIVTPASMKGIFIGRFLSIGGTAENVTVTAITATTFTAVFANAHTSADAVTAISNSYQGAIIERNYIHDNTRASGIIINSDNNTIRDNVIRHIGLVNTQHGIYMQGGLNVIENNLVEGIYGYGAHQFPAHTRRTESSGNKWLNNTFRDCYTSYLYVDMDTSDGTNPLYPEASPHETGDFLSLDNYVTPDDSGIWGQTSLTRYTSIIGNTFSKSDGSSSPIFQDILTKGPVIFDQNILEDMRYVNFRSPDALIGPNNIVRRLRLSSTTAFPEFGSYTGGRTAKSEVSAPPVSALTGVSAYPRAITNVEGADLLIAAGIGQRLFTCISNTAGAVVVTIEAVFARPSISTGFRITLTSGVNFTLGSDNTSAQLHVTAQNLAEAIKAAALVGDLIYPTPIGPSVFLDKSYQVIDVIITTNQAGRVSATQAADGEIFVEHPFTLLDTFTQGGLISGEGSVLSVSGNAIEPTNQIHRVGAGLIKVITLPLQFTSGSFLIIPTAAFTTDQSGNIGSAPTTAILNQLMTAAYASSYGKWFLSY